MPCHWLKLDDESVEQICRKLGVNMADKCRSCAAEIIWLKHHVTGKANPIDALARSNGNLVLHPENGTYRFATEVEKEAARIDAVKLYVSHFAVCPDAKHYRSKAVRG